MILPSRARAEDGPAIPLGRLQNGVLSFLWCKWLTYDGTVTTGEYHAVVVAPTAV